MSTVKIMGYPVDVRFCRVLPLNLSGALDTEEHVIWICTTLSEQEQYATFLHEAAHFIFFKTHLADEVLNTEQVSLLVENLATIEWED